MNGYSNGTKETLTMNKKQIIVLWIGIIVIVLMGLFPPWTLNGEAASVFLVSLRDSTSIRQYDFPMYRFILTPPKTLNVAFLLRIDFNRLLLQWIMVAVITAGFVVSFKEKSRKP